MTVIICTFYIHHVVIIVRNTSISYVTSLPFTLQNLARSSRSSE